MKNKLLLLFCFISVIAGCAKSFLEVPLQGQGSSTNDPQVIAAEVTGAYNALITPDPTQSGFGQYDIHGIYFLMMRIKEVMLQTSHWRQT
jgi:hypothetical protein